MDFQGVQVANEEQYLNHSTNWLYQSPDRIGWDFFIYQCREFGFEAIPYICFMGP
jgi:hypothetical protein